MPVRLLTGRPVVFGLAFLSFACLFGAFYGLWTMRTFGVTVLPLATTGLVALGGAGPRAGARLWVVEGALGGIVAAVAYDLYRLPFVLNGAPLFRVFGRFGELLLGEPSAAPRALVLGVGWLYHFSNGAALGIMFLAMAAGRLRPRGLLWGAVAWALVVETVLLLTPYAKFFGLPLNGRFLFLTATAHVVFGLALGAWCRWRVPRTLRADA